MPKGGGYPWLGGEMSRGTATGFFAQVLNNNVNSIGRVGANIPG